MPITSRVKMAKKYNGRVGRTELGQKMVAEYVARTTTTTIIAAAATSASATTWQRSEERRKDSID